MNDLGPDHEEEVRRSIEEHVELLAKMIHADRGDIRTPVVLMLREVNLILEDLIELAATEFDGLRSASRGQLPKSVSDDDGGPRSGESYARKKRG